MPRLSEATPKYRFHRASGQAVATIQGRDFYLGPWNSKASKVEYDRIISEWLIAGRQLPSGFGGVNDLTIVEILARYKKFAVQHYRKDDIPTGEWGNIQYAIEPLKRLYGRTLVRDFGPLDVLAHLQGLALLNCWNEPMPFLVADEDPLEVQHPNCIVFANGAIDLDSAEDPGGHFRTARPPSGGVAKGRRQP